MVLLPPGPPALPTDYSMPSSPSPASIPVCFGDGRIIPYFEDVDKGSGLGFDDVVEGQRRRDCVCEVIKYVESVFLIDNHITASNPIYIKFDEFTSVLFNPAYLRATVSPRYDLGNVGYENSYMQEAMINGSPSNLANENCGSIRINWQYAPYFAYCGSGTTLSGCQEDFFQLILHEMTHLMGFTSAVVKSASLFNLSSGLGLNSFTTFDEHFLYFKKSSGTLQQMVTPGSVPSISYSLSSAAFPLGEIWLNADPLSTTKTNQPMLDIGDVAPAVNPSYNHLTNNYFERSWEAPGMAVPYVMDWALRPGYAIHTYSLEELKVMQTLGLTPNTTYADWANVPNKPPYILGGVLDRTNAVITNTASPNYSANGHLVQAIPGGNADLVTSTSSCHPVIIDLNALTTSQPGRGTMTGWNLSTAGATIQPLHLYEDDASQSISVYQGKLWPITGCSNDMGTATTAPLSLNGNTITFTPRPNFIGRARFGFHLYDGIERGAFVVITIDVQKDNCFSTSCEMVVNGDLEEGTEYNYFDAGAGNYVMPTVTDETDFMTNYINGSRAPNYFGGQILSDGVEPRPISHLPEFNVVNTYTPDFCLGPIFSYYTIPQFRWPLSTVAGRLSECNPVSTTSANRRYINQSNASNGDGAVAFTLHNTLLPDANYKVEFDYLTNATDIGFYFTNTLISTPTWTFASVPASDASVGYTITPTSACTWAHFNTTFRYNISGSPSNSFMRMGSTSGGNLSLDNLSLQRIIDPQITQNAVPCGNITLTASVRGGAIVSWQWFDGAGNTIPGATSSTFIAPGYGTYSVSAVDINGCSGMSVLFNFPDPCAKFSTDVSPRTIYPLTGTITSLPGGTNSAYHICGTLTITSSVTFNQDYILMEPGSQIIVDQHAKLSILNSHMATCPGTTDMWQGITIGNDGARIKVANGSLIEDAKIAITVLNKAGLSIGNPIIETDEAIFNRNNIGINITNFASTHSQDFRFVNTVFTSRYLDLYNDFKQWDPVAFMLNKTSGNPTYLPYDIAAPSKKYRPLPCKDLSPALTGIYCSNASMTTGTPGAYTFQSIVVGEGNPNSPGQRNMFDNLRAGIEAHNTSVTVRNSTFELMQNISKVGGYGSLGSIGIYAENQAPNIKQLDIADGNQPWHNEFYENRSGITSWHNYTLQATGCQISSSNQYGADPTTLHTLVGENGVEVHNYTDYNLLNISNNAINGMMNGIMVTSNVNYAIGIPNRQIKIWANTISLDKALPTLAITNKSQGIFVENLLLKSGGASGPALPWVSVQDNTLSNAYNGIAVNNFFAPWTEVNSNTVNMQQTDNKLAQYGISELHGNNNWVISNTVTNSASNNDNSRGIYTASSWAPVINCNTVSSTARAFEFYGGYQSQTNWLANHATSNGKALVLNNSYIGDQTNASSYQINPWACMNHWSNNTWDTWTISSMPANSRLYILFGSTPDLVPTLNSGSPFLPSSLVYSSVSPYNGIATGITPYTACGPTWQQAVLPMKPQKRMASEDVAQDSITYGANQDRNCWMAQMQLYSALVQDTALQNSSPIVSSFYTFVHGTRYDWLVQVEDSLAAGNISAAQALMTAMPAPANHLPGPNGVLLRDGLVGDTLIANYLNFFQLYIDWNSSNFMGGDSATLLTLAQLCPHLDGAVIYQARALKHIITHDYTPYNDNCGELPNGNERKILAGSTQEYKLLPNPNNGNFKLWQKVADDNPVTVSVYSIVGQKLLQTNKIFAKGFVEVSLVDLPSGIYYLNMQDSKGQLFVFKFLKH
ncbi:MAG: T9SS type A sorting domain-containing protein [Chitinophagaceae bacterium]